MWESISIFILRYRLYFILALLAATAFMGYHAMDAKLAYDYFRVVPKDDPVAVNYQNFQNTFSQDGNVMVIAMQSRAIFDLDVFSGWYDLSHQVEQVEGIEGVLSLANVFNVVKDSDSKSFRLEPIVKGRPVDQPQVDSIKAEFLNLPFYQGLIHNQDAHTTLMAITFDPDKLDSKARLSIVEEIQGMAETFGARHNIDLHFSGLPFIRTYNMNTISRELQLFLILAMVIVALILFILFKNIYAVIFPLFVVIAGAIWSLGTLSLLGFKITILTGLLPTLIVVIGIPNCIYLLNKYHSEFKKHGNKQKALMRTISKIGHNTFFTNLTTAIGFGVFFFTNTRLLAEFGMVAFFNILATFVISLIAIPVVFSYLPAPKVRHTTHLDRKVLNVVLDKFELWSFHYRRYIFIIFIGILIVAIGGLFRLKAEGYILDDVSHRSTVYKDLKFLEKHFNGIMPFEVMITSTGKQEVTDLPFLQKLDEATTKLDSVPVLSKPISVSQAFKFMMQAYYNGNPRFYQLPSQFMIKQNPVLRSYLKNIEVDSAMGPTTGFITKDKKTTRISTKVADVGSDSLPKLLATLKPKLDSIFPVNDYNVTITGTSIIATEGFNFLIDGLIYSVGIAFLAIGLIMSYLFRSVRMLLFSLLPNIFPLIITAGIMGYFNIPLKPSTVLVFSVAFGISVDYTIHFLAKYRQELHRHIWDVKKTVMVSLKETGVSMLYTSLILFFGFIIFTLSEFEGTANLGRLTSITLVVALLSNLLFLPAMLIYMGKYADRKKPQVTEANSAEPVKDIDYTSRKEGTKFDQ